MLLLHNCKCALDSESRADCNRSERTLTRIAPWRKRHVHVPVSVSVDVCFTLPHRHGATSCASGSGLNLKLAPGSHRLWQRARLAS